MRSNRAYRVIWGELENLGQQMGQAFAEAFEVGRTDSENTIYPLLDVIERNEELWVFVEIPGVSKSDIQLQIEDNTLVITGEIKRLPAEEGGRYLRSERFYGRFKRTVHTVYQVDVEQVSANFKDGILSIHLPRHEASRAHTVNINVN